MSQPNEKEIGTPSSLSKEEIQTCHAYVLRAFLQTQDQNSEGDIKVLRERALAQITKNDTEDLSTLSVKQLQEQCKLIGKPIYGKKIFY